MTRPEAKIPDDNPPSLADHIRQAARESGLSVYRLAKDAEVDQSTLNKFLTGGRDNLTLEVADRLFRVLGLRVTRPRPKRRGSEKPGGGETPHLLPPGPRGGAPAPKYWFFPPPLPRAPSLP